ncbi:MULTISPECIES: FecR domain-containing protein [Aphanothece]|uniref:FecR domain-containing protein n=1 Tax=Aphanothece TaxID=1121 RepID=UPI00398EB387
MLGLVLVPGVQAARPLPRVVEVPSRPAFVRPPGRSEQTAAVGQLLPGSSLLRTQRPGRLQVLLAQGRSFRLGGDAVMRLTPSGLDLERGQLIAWVEPGAQGREPLRVRTRVGTASIEGTTVFLEVDDTAVTVFSWEGQVRFSPNPAGGEGLPAVVLRSGEQVAYREGAWLPPRRLGREEVMQRRRRSLLLNGFSAPMATLPVIERELGLLNPP